MELQEFIKIKNAEYDSLRGFIVTLGIDSIEEYTIAKRLFIAKAICYEFEDCSLSSIIESISLKMLEFTG